MSIFLFSLALFMLAFYLGSQYGKASILSQSIKTTEGFLDDILKEIDRRKNLSKLAKSRKRVSGRFVKE